MTFSSMAENEVKVSTQMTILVRVQRSRQDKHLQGLMGKIQELASLKDIMGHLVGKISSQKYSCKR